MLYRDVRRPRTCPIDPEFGFTEDLHKLQEDYDFDIIELRSIIGRMERKRRERVQKRIHRLVRDFDLCPISNINVETFDERRDGIVL